MHVCSRYYKAIRLYLTVNMAVETMAVFEGIIMWWNLDYENYSEIEI